MRSLAERSHQAGLVELLEAHILDSEAPEDRSPDWVDQGVCYLERMRMLNQLQGYEQAAPLVSLSGEPMLSEIVAVQPTFPIIASTISCHWSPYQQFRC